MKRFPAWLALAAALGVAVRVAWVLAGDWQPGGLVVDALLYHDLGLLIAEGEGFANPAERGAGASVPTGEKPPLFPLLLALFSLAEVTGIDGHRLVGCLLGGVTIALAGLLGRRVAGERAGLAAAALTAANPFFVSIDGGLLSEALYAPLLITALLAGLELADRPGAGPPILLGALAGAAALTRPEGLLLLPVLLLPLIARSRAPRRGLRLAIACTAMLAVLAPWTVRNAVQFDRFVVVSTQSGIPIGGANCPLTYRGPDLGSWRLDCIPPEVARIENEAENADTARRVGLEYARDHAGRLPVVLGARLLRTFGVYGTGGPAYPGGLAAPPPLRITLYLLLLALAVPGLVLLRRRGRPLLPVLVPVAIALCVTVAAFGSPRFRHSVELALTIPAGLALAEGAARLRGRRALSTRPRGRAPAA